MDIDHDILYLQLKVNRLMVEIKALDDSRVQKQKEAKYHAALLSPVRLLPLEILATIFHYAISVEPHGPGPRSNAAPFGVSHVCSSWRAAALSCPDLWNRLTLRPSHNPTAQNPWSYIFNTVMVSWFERAGPSLPLSLSFTCHVDKSNLDPDINREICQKITHFSPRFSELNIALDYCTALMPFLSLPGDSLPLLETLSFDNMKCHNDCSKITVFNAAPRLRAVTLHNIGSSDLIGDHPLSLPWSQLSYLEIEGKIRSEAFAAVLFQCTQIESASFARVDIDNLSDFADGASSADDAVTLARLATLKLAVEGPEDYGGINHVLEILKLPNLQTLTLVGDRRSDESQILSHMGHNVSRLRHLLLDAYRSPAEIVELIGKCVMLETTWAFARPPRFLHFHMLLQGQRRQRRRG
ncbi:hypothetical protein FPV67DRAFT_1527483 [Lyophyllum atratum]|nr:hypothetical protein FPV67DRAFT_1527483 [Lyophyllum atratum]